MIITANTITICIPFQQIPGCCKPIQSAVILIMDTPAQQCLLVMYVLHACSPHVALAR